MFQPVNHQICDVAFRFRKYQHVGSQELDQRRRVEITEAGGVRLISLQPEIEIDELNMFKVDNFCGIFIFLVTENELSSVCC